MKKISCNDDLVTEIRERYFAEPVQDGQEKVLELRKTRVPGDKQFEVIPDLPSSTASVRENPSNAVLLAV